MKTRPIDLIVANMMHEAVDASESVDDLVKELKKAGFRVDGKPTVPDLAEKVAREMLCRVAHDATMEQVFKALAAVGAPCCADDINEGMRAVKERMG